MLLLTAHYVFDNDVKSWRHEDYDEVHLVRHEVTEEVL